MLLLLLGGAMGTSCRYYVSALIYTVITQPTFPYANLVINVAGSFLIGMLAELFDTRVVVAPAVRVALLTECLAAILPSPASHWKR